MRTCLLPALLLVLGAPLATAQDDPVKVTFSVEPAEAKAGQTVELRASVVVDAGWHVYGPTEEQGQPTLFKPTAAEGASLSGEVVSPEPHIEDVPYMGKMQFLRGTVVFSQQVKLAGDASGSLSFPVELSYQACSDGDGGVCLPPQKANTTLTLTVSAAPADPAPDDGSAMLEDGDVPDEGTADGGDLGFGGDLFGGGDEGGDDSEAAEAITVSARVEPSSAPPGGVVELRFDVTVAEDWYIYGTETPESLPTALDLELPAGWTAVGKLAGPEAKKKEYDHGGFDYVYTAGTVTFVQKVQVAADSAAATFPVAGKLNYQSCNASVCLPGETAFSLEVDVAADAAPTGVDATPPQQQTSPPAAKKKESGPLFLIGASIALGLAMLLMPCTYPMIPITVSLFSKGKTLTRRQSVTRAAIYGGGIVFSFVLVGGLVQVFFGGEGQGALNALATNAWVNLVIGAIFVYFALSFFGYYELGLPGPLRRAMQMGTAKTDSDGTVPAWSLFLMGLFFVLTTYTCGAPVVFGLFATAAQDPHPFAILGATFVFAVTIALPFFVLALAPSAMKFMPKSGSWFSVFKAVLGFVELGFAVKFFRGTDLQWDFVNLLPRPVSLALWVVLCVAAALLLHGYFPIKFPHMPDLTKWSAKRYAWGWAFIVLGGYFAYGAAGYPLNANIEAFLLPDPQEASTATDGDGPVVRLPGEGKQVVYGGLSYYTDLDGLERAQAAVKKSGKPAFLLFTGHYCSNCVQMERGILPTDRVREKLENTSRIALYIDKADDPAEEAHKKLMLDRYNKSGAIPAYYVIGADGSIKSSIIGSVSEDAFVEFLEAGGL